MNRVIVYEDKQGIDHYFIEGKPYELEEYPKEYTCKRVYIVVGSRSSLT